MRASLQFRQGDGSHHSPCGPLFRLKLPVSLLGLPLPLFSGCSLGSAPSDVSLSLGTAFTAGPSLRLTYRPIRAPALSAAPRDDSTDAAAGDSGGNSASLHLVLKAGLGRLGSSRDASLSVAAELEFCPSAITAGGAPSSGVGGSGFRVPLRAHIRFKAEPRVGDLSFRRFPSAAAAAAPKGVAVASAEIPPSRSAKPCAQSSSGSGEPSVSACTALSIGPRSRSSSPQSGGSSNGGSQGGSRGGSRGGSPGPGAVGGEGERTSADGLATPTAAACNGIPPAASSAISSPRGPAAAAAAAAASSPSGKNSGSSSEGVVAGGASDSPPGEGTGGGVGMAQLALSSSAAVPAARVLSQRLTLSPSPPHSPTAAAAAAAATAAAAAAVAAVAASGQHVTWQWSAADVANAVRIAGWGIGVRSSVPLGTHGVASLRWRLTLPHSTPSPSSPPPPPPALNPPAGSPNTNTRSSSSSGWLSSAHAPTLHLDKISVDVRTGAFRFIPACWAMHEPQPPLPDSLPQPLPAAATTGAGITTTRPPSLPTPTTLVLPGVGPRLLLMPSGPLGLRPVLVPPGGSPRMAGRGQGGGAGGAGEQGEVSRLRSELVGVRAEGQRLRQQVDELRAAVCKGGAGEGGKAGGVGETKGKGGKEGGAGATAAAGRAEAGKGGGSAAAAGSGGGGKDGKAAAPAPSAAGAAPAGVGAGSKAQSGGSGGSEKEKQGGGLFGRWRGRGDKKEEKKEKSGTTSSGSSSSSGGGGPGAGGAAGSGSSVPVASKAGPASSAAAGAAAGPEGLGRPGIVRGSGAGASVGVDIPVSASRADLTAVRNSPAHGHGQGYGHGHGHSTLLHGPGATVEGHGPAVGKGSVAGQGALGASAGAVAAQLELEEGLRQAILQARAGAA